MTLSKCFCGIKDCTTTAVIVNGQTGFKRASRAGNGVKKRAYNKGVIWPGMNIGYNPTRKG